MTSTAIAPRQAAKSILATVEEYAEQIGQLAPRGVEPTHYVASLRLYLANNPKVLECSPKTIAIGMLRVAQTGLELGVSCDLLPFGKDAQFSPRYNGIIELALAAGARSVNADVVREGDFFEWEKGTSFHLRHRKEAKHGARITHAYAIAELKPGSYVFEVISRQDIDMVRTRYSKQWKNGTLEDIPWYAKKRAVRVLAPYLPKNPRFAAALQFAAAEEEPDEIAVSAVATIDADAADEARAARGLTAGETVDADGVVHDELLEAAQEALDLEAELDEETEAFVMPVCPVCQGPVWDNRQKNEQRAHEGKRRMPSFSCRNKECAGVIWSSSGVDKPRKEAA
jgi:recombination protein RecT